MTATKRSAALLGRLRGGAGVHSHAAILAEIRRVILEGGVPPGTPIPVEQADPADDERALQALHALDRAMAAEDHREYSAASRRFDLALVTPSRMRPLLATLESAWNVTEPFQPMALISSDERRQLHAEHREMLETFLARDAEALLPVAGRHLDQLDSCIAGLPVDTGRFSAGDAEPADPGQVGV